MATESEREEIFGKKEDFGVQGEREKIFGKKENRAAFDRESIFGKQGDPAAAERERIFGEGAAVSDISPAPEFSLFEKISSAFELTGSLTRELAMQAHDGLDLRQFGKIITGDKRVTANKFKKFIERKHGLDLTIGGNDQNIAQKAGNFLVDLGIDIVTDPIGATLWSVPMRSVKGLRKIGALKNLSDNELKLLTGATVGGAIGLAGRQPGEDDNIILDTAKGAVLGVLGTGAVNVLKRTAPEISAAAYDAYIKLSRPDLFDEMIAQGQRPSMARRTAEKFAKDPENLAIRRRNFNDRMAILKYLDDKGGEDLVNRFVDIRDEAFVQTIKKRNETLRGLEQIAKLEGKEFILADKLDDATRLSNTYVGDWVETQLRGVPDAFELSEAMRMYKNSNRKVISEFNKRAADKGVNTLNVPIDFHTADLLKKEATEDIFKVFSEDMIKTGFGRRVSENFYKGQDLKIPVDPVARELISSERVMNALADGAEKNARRMMARILNENPKEGLFKVFESGLESYDEFMGFIKRMHLTFTHSWLQNNFIDNTLRAYMIDSAATPKLAIKSALESNPLRAFTKNSMYKEIMEATSPVESLRKFKPATGEMGVAMDLGVVDDNFFRDVDFLAREKYGELIARVGKDKAAAILGKMRNRNHLARFAYGDNYLNNITDYVRKLGSSSENTSRMLAFRHFYKTYMDETPGLAKQFKQTFKGDVEAAFRGSDEMKEVFNRAAKSVNDTFFDYGNVLEMEQAVFKRIMPYYTFFSRNFDYWARQFTENTGSINRVMKLQANLGRPLTEEERLGVPDWLLQQGARAGEQTPDGMTLRTIPNISLADAIKLMNLATDQGSIGDEALSKLSPVIKAAMEQYRGKEFFLDQPLTDKEGVRGKGRRVFAQGLPGAFAAKYAGLGDLEINEKGKAKTKSEAVARTSNLQQNLLPLPIVSNMMQIYREVQAGKGLGESVRKRGPVKDRLVTLEEAKRNVTRRTRDRKRKDTGRVK